MSKIGPKNAVTAAKVAKTGQTNVTRVGAGAGKQTQKQQATVTSPGGNTNRTSNSGGIQTTTKPDGSTTKKADSGLQFDKSTDGTRTISFGNSEEKLKLSGDDVEVTGGGAKNAQYTRTEDGMELISFNDAKGNTVQVEPESMTFEVLNKKQTVAQVFHPNGNQEVVAFGTHRSPDGTHTNYEKRALFDKEGGLVDQEGFDNLKSKGGKISFQLGEGTATRTLARPLPGQPEVAEAPKQESKAVKTESAPVSLLAEQPLLLTGPEQPKLLEYKPETGKPEQMKLPMDMPEVKTPAKPEVAEAPKNSNQADTSSKQLELPLDKKPVPTEPKEKLAWLKDVSNDYFNPKNPGPDVEISESPSGVIRRTDGEGDSATLSFSLPTGDKFRTDGDQIAVLGDNPRAKSPQLAQEDDGRVLLSFKDKQRNSYQFDVNSGDIQISSPDGKRRQVIGGDGSESFEMTSVHKTEAGSVRESTHKVSFDSDGKLVSKEGFDNLKVGDKHLEYTLPNGQPTVRNLFSNTKVKHNDADMPKTQSAPAPAADDWGGADSIVNSVLGKTTAPTQTEQAAGPTQTNAPLEASPFEKPKFAPSGMSRTKLPDGSTMTRLPNGITITDGEKISAKDKDGSPLQVIKREVPSQGTYVLFAKGKDGHGFTIAPDHMDMIAESKDGKVHQLVTEKGQILTNIKDGPNQHLHNFEMGNMMETASPGVRSDVRTPNTLYIDGPEGRSYELPQPLPSPQSGMTSRPYGQAPPNHPQPGYKPSFWDKTKAFFKGEPIPQAAPGPNGPQPNSNQYHHQQPPQFGQMPGSCHSYDHGANEMRQMQRMTSVMSTVSWVGLGLTALSTFAMPGMFFPYGGYGW